MKNYILKIIIPRVLVLYFGLFFLSCCSYLDIVPDNEPQYEDLFVSQMQAYNALATCYAGLNGNIDYRDRGESPLGDEWVATNPSLATNRTYVQGSKIMSGQQAASDPLLDYWTGNNYIGGGFYVYIRHCDMLIQNIDLVPDMLSEDKADWKGQATFLKAYYLFKLVQEFGPVILPKNVSPDAPDKDIFLPRSKVEDCFAYILNLLDQSVSLLKERAGVKESGQIDKVIATAFKAYVLLYRASPFYNGNSEYYANFLDHDGQPFFPMGYDAEKWKEVITAADAALALCGRNGIRLFYYRDQPYKYDTLDYHLNEEKLKTIYDLRFRIVDPTWNCEVIWGEIGASTSWSQSSSLTDGALLYKPASYGGSGTANQGPGWMAASLQPTLRYYSKHGLPLGEDITINVNTLYDIVTTPDENNPEFAQWRGIIQPGVPVAQMYLNREPRFYSDLILTGGYYRAHQVRINAMMFVGTDCGYLSQFGERFNATGIGVQKIIHPESFYAADARHLRVLYPQPFLRYADLLLTKAEAMNEYSGPSQEVYDLVNQVRIRAGIPTLEESYSNPEWVTAKAMNKHLTKEGMREIIRSERNNEFAFENGNNFWDNIRWKTAVSRYSNQLWGWNYLGNNYFTFFRQTIVQGRKWSISDCLWPVMTREMEANSSLIQNPGW